LLQYFTSFRSQPVLHKICFFLHNPHFDCSLNTPGKGSRQQFSIQYRNRCPKTFTCDMNMWWRMVLVEHVNFTSEKFANRWQSNPPFLWKYYTPA